MGAKEEELKELKELQDYREKILKPKAIELIKAKKTEECAKLVYAADGELIINGGKDKGGVSVKGPVAVATELAKLGMTWKYSISSGFLTTAFLHAPDNAPMHYSAPSWNSKGYGNSKAGEGRARIFYKKIDKEWKVAKM